MNSGIPSQSSRTKVFSLGEYSVDPAARTVSSPQGVITLKPRAMDVLAYLAAHDGEVVTHRQLLDQYWRGEFSSPNAVHKCITQIRKALDDERSTPRFIATVPRRGYRLIEKPVATSHGNHEPVSAPTAATGTPAHPLQDPDDAEADHFAPPAHAITRRRRQWFAVAALALSIACAAVWHGQFRTARLVELRPAIPAQSSAAVHSASAPSATDKPVRDDDTASTSGDIQEIASRRILLAPLHATDSASRAAAHAIHSGLAQRLELQRQVTIVPQAEPRAAVDAKGEAVDIREIGERSNSEYVITGHVATAEGGLRVRLRLWHVASATSAYDFDRVLGGTTRKVVGVASSAMDAAVHVFTQRGGAAAMAEVGARDPEAFLLFLDACASRTLRNQAGIRRALDTFKMAIALDPNLLRAYELFADDAPELMRYTTDKQVHAALLAEVQAMRRALPKQLPTSATLRLFDVAETKLRGDGYAAREAQLRAQIAALKPGEPCYCYNRYIEFLLAGRLYDEAERFRLRVLQDQPGNPFFTLTTRSSIIRLRDGPFMAENAIRETLVVFPNDVAVLSGIVPVLAQTGDFEEAEQYLRHLESVDRDGLWSYYARLMLQALRGDLKPGSPELRRALEHPSITPVSRGIVLFTLGDVQGGIDAWSSLRPDLHDTLASNITFVETTFPKQVLQDPRYQALLERLGIGASWTAQLRRNVASIAHITGIPPGPYAEPAASPAITASARTAEAVPAN